MSDAYQAALRGGLSAVPKEAKPSKVKKPSTSTSTAPPPAEAESAGVKAAKALLAKMDDGNDGDAGGEEKKSVGYEAALRGGLSAAIPKDAAASKQETKQPKPVEDSAGVKAAKALLEKMDDGNDDDDKDASDSAAVNDALKKGLAAAAGLDKASRKEDKEKIKAEQKKAVADQAKSWLEGKTQEEKDAMIQQALRGGLSSAASKPKAAKKKKDEEEDDAEPLPSSVEAWLVQMKRDSVTDDADLSAAVKAALAGGASAAAVGPTGGKSKTSAEKVYSIPPGVASWIEANQTASKWEEEAGETMTNAMYGGGIASMMAAKKKAEAKPKKKVVAEEDIIPKSIQKWLDKNNAAVPADAGDEPLRESSLHIPPEVAKFLEEAKKEHNADEITAAFSELLK